MDELCNSRANLLLYFSKLLRADERRSDAGQLIILEYTSRIFHLVLVIKNVKDLAPRGCSLSQLNAGQNSIESTSDPYPRRAEAIEQCS